MKGKVLAVVMTAVLGLMGFLYGPKAQARTTPEAAVESIFADVNSGALGAALEAFSADATARNMVRGETYTGSDEIGQMLAGMHKEGRRLDVVGARTVGNRTIVTAEISDGGLVWGTEWFVVELKNGKIQYFELTAVRLKF